MDGPVSVDAQVVSPGRGAGTLYRVGNSHRLLQVIGLCVRSGDRPDVYPPVTPELGQFSLGDVAAVLDAVCVKAGPTGVPLHGPGPLHLVSLQAQASREVSDLCARPVPVEVSGVLLALRVRRPWLRPREDRQLRQRYESSPSHLAARPGHQGGLPARLVGTTYVTAVGTATAGRHVSGEPVNHPGRMPWG